VLYMLLPHQVSLEIKDHGLRQSDQDELYPQLNGIEAVLMPSRAWSVLQPQQPIPTFPDPIRGISGSLSSAPGPLS
jgi:hypothetical protein